jgi:hypothetical protein
LIRSSGFRKAVLQEAVDGLLAGGVETGKALLRDYVNGTMGFERLRDLMGIPTQGLVRLLGRPVYCGYQFASRTSMPLRESAVVNSCSPRVVGVGRAPLAAARTHSWS